MAEDKEKLLRGAPSAEELESGEFEGPPHSLWYDAYKRLIKDRLAVISFCVIVIYILAALSADLFLRWGVLYHPTEHAQAELINQGPMLDHEIENSKGELVPSGNHVLGVDANGRDVLSRCIYGTRISLRIMIFTQVLALFIGITIGAIGGYFGGWVDDIVTWLISVFWSFPFILAVIALSLVVRDYEISGTRVIDMKLTLFGSEWYFGNELALCLAIGFVGWVGIARIVRAQFISLRGADYVDSARALGAGSFRIIFKHILPNSLAPIIVIATIQMALVVQSEAALSFLGVGIERPNPSWGRMISDSYTLLEYWWEWLFPSLFLMINVFAFNLFGDGLRDALDPKQQIT